MDDRTQTTIHVVLLSLLAAGFRLVPWMSLRPLTFDEGVFLASTDLARSGLTPFQDFFSSQGPLFIPLLRFGQVVSFGDSRGGRTTVLLAAVVITVALYFVLRRFTSPTRAFLLSSFAATSGTLLLAAGPVQSDGVALALAMSTLALALQPRASRIRTLGVGLLAGAAISVKSFHVVPILLAIAAVLISEMDWKRFGAVVLSAAGTVVVLAMPNGAGQVWDQYVLFHLAKDNSPDLLKNLQNTGQLFFKYDLPLLVLLALSIGYAFKYSPPRLAGRTTRSPSWIPVLWLIATIVLLFGFTAIDSGFARTLAFLVPPLIAVAALSESVPIRGLLAVAVVGAIIQFARVDIIPGTDAIEEAAIEGVSSIPPDRYFVGDDPGLGWAGARLSHPDTVDPSYARFATGYLNVQDIDAALRDPKTCIFFSISDRFDSAGVVPPDDYLPTGTPGVYRRADC